MPKHCLLYYITDRKALAPDEATREKCLLEKIREAAYARVDYIQLREKDLPTSALESLTRQAVGLLKKLRAENSQLTTKLLINSRTDVALAAGADGVHLRSDDVSPEAIRSIWTKTHMVTPASTHVGTATSTHVETPAPTHVRTAAPGCPASQSGAPAASPANEISPAPLIGISCHSPFEVHQAAEDGATFAVFAPVFEKKNAPASQPVGLSQLRQACKAKIPVLALGGVTLGNARFCLEAGAAGIAAIRLFQENEIAGVVARFSAFL